MSRRVLRKDSEQEDSGRHVTGSPSPRSSDSVRLKADPHRSPPSSAGDPEAKRQDLQSAAALPDELVEAFSSSDFDPSTDTILSFLSAALSGKDSLRVALSARESYLHYHYRALPHLQTSLPQGTSLQPVSALPVPREDSAFVFGSLLLSRRCPLDCDDERDPLEGFAHAARALGENEGAEVVLDLRRVPWGEARRWFQEQALESRSDGLGAAFLRGMFPSAAKPKANSTFHVKHSDTPLVVAVIASVGAYAETSERAWEVARRFGLGPLEALCRGGSRFSLKRVSERQYRKQLEGKAWPFRVTAEEIQGLVVPPTIHCKATNVVRTGGIVPDPPPDLPDYSKDDPDLLLLGRVQEHGTSRIVGWERSNALFLFRAGATGSGKTQGMLGWFLPLMLSGTGGMYLDPDRDAIEYGMGWLGPVADRIVEVNLAPHEGALRVPGWNPVNVRSADEIDDAVGDVRDAVAASLGWRSGKNSRAITLMENVLRTLCEIGLLAPPADCPTIFQTIALVDNEKWRGILLPHLSRAMRDFWEHSFPKLPPDARGPVTQIAQRLRQSAGTLALFGQSVSTYRISEFMDAGKIVLVCPRAAGKEATTLLTTLFVSDVVRAARARESRPLSERREFWLFGDEALDLPPWLVMEALNHARKDNMRIALANQDPSHLNADLFSAIMTNGSYRAAAGMSADGAAKFVKEWQHRVEVGAITGVGTNLHDFVLSIRRNKIWTDPFRVTTVPVEEIWGPRDPDAPRAIREAATTYQTPAEVKASLETLEDRIAHSLLACAKTFPQPERKPDGLPAKWKPIPKSLET